MAYPWSTCRGNKPAAVQGLNYDVRVFRDAWDERPIAKCRFVAVGRMVGGPKPHADPLAQVGRARVVDSDLGATNSDIRAIGVVTISERWQNFSIFKRPTSTAWPVKLAAPRLISGRGWSFLRGDWWISERVCVIGMTKGLNSVWL